MQNIRLLEEGKLSIINIIKQEMNLIRKMKFKKLILVIVI